MPLYALHDRVATFDKFVNELQKLIPVRESTEYQKGHVTGHSFRRGFTKAALLAGFSLEQIMLHGDWSHPDSVLTAYAAGAVLPSIPMAYHTGKLLTGAGSFVSPVKFSANSAAQPSVTAVPNARAVTMPAVSVNPFAVVDGSGSGNSASPDPVWLAKRARQWEFDKGVLSPTNPFRPSGAEEIADLAVWREQRARAWELDNNMDLVDNTTKKPRKHNLTDN